ncbi:MAG: DUF1565 domain-containing protein [Planctomycetota bacterium]
MVASPLARAQATTVWVDARVGDDAKGTGTATAPWRTLTRAVAANGARLDTTFRLRPGRYDEALGEAYPIVLPARCTVEADPAVVPPGSVAVQFGSSLALTALLRTTSAANGKVVVRDLFLTGGMFRGVQGNVSGQGMSLDLTVERCRIQQSRCVAVNASSAATCLVTLRDCALTGPDTPLTFNLSQDAQAVVAVERCTVRSGLRAGLYVSVDTRSKGLLHVVNTAVEGATKAGLLTDLRSGTLAVQLDHCLFKDIGKGVIGGSPGAIVNVQASSWPTFSVRNTAFTSVVNEVPGINTAAFTWTTCLVQDAALAKLGGNVQGSPTFLLSANAEDYRLAPGSPGIDRGTAGSVTDDLYGQPRGGAFSPTAPDIGPAEHHDLVCHVATKPTAGSLRLELAAVGPPNTGVFLFVADGTTTTPWVPGLHLSGTILPFAGGTTDAGGVWSTVLVPAGIPKPVEAWFQALFLSPPYLGRNAARAVW